MNDLTFFENTSIRINDGEVFATRQQVAELYESPRKTLDDNINKLKSDGLLSGAKIRHTARDGKSYETEVYNLDEILAIGMRLRSDKAIMFQRWAINVLKKEIFDMHEKSKMQQAQLDYFWDKEDQKDLYK